jgi:DNA-binding NarL/FixJ family response regulator
VVTERTVGAHVTQILLKLGIGADAGMHRLVQAVLAFLRGQFT